MLTKREKRMKRPRRRPSFNAAARVFRVKPDPSKPFHVEVRIARTRLLMNGEQRRLDHEEREDPRTMGLVRHWLQRRGRRVARYVVRPRGLIARMYLNVNDLRARPSEIVSHECTHAGMAWARLRGANLRVMAGEEVLCHAVGRLVAQVNRVCFAMKVWP
jgi:hypothetical protein